MKNNKIIPKAGAWVIITQNIPTVIPVHQFAIYYAVPSGEHYFTGERLSYNRHQGPGYNEHPQTGEDLTRLLGLFERSMDILKRGLVNYYIGNKHYDFTDAQIRELKAIGRDKLMELFPIESQVKIITDSGAVCIQSEEYNLVSEEKLAEYFELAKDGHAFISYLSKSRALKGKVVDQVFYLRTRGISYSEALNLCIGQVTTSNLLYLYMHPAYVERFMREGMFTAYINKHLTHMEIHNEELFVSYLEQVQQIEGYHKFEYKTSGVQKIEEVTL